jgi:hypothetical protein
MSSYREDDDRLDCHTPGLREAAESNGHPVGDTSRINCVKLQSATDHIPPVPTDLWVSQIREVVYGNEENFLAILNARQ